MSDALRVVLIEPGDRFSEDGVYVLGKQTPSLGLVSIATYLKQHGISVRVFDSQVACHEDHNPLPAFLKSFAPQIVGIQAYSYNLNAARQVACLVRSLLPLSRVLLGGVHPSVLPYETLQICSEADAVVVGEGEESVLEYCQNFLKCVEKPVSGIINRQTGPGGNSPFIPRPLVEDLDKLPFPDWSILNYSMYKRAYSEAFQRMELLLPISTSRGCFFSCGYCHGSFLGKKVRFRSPKSVVQEILKNYDRGFKFFYFTDPNFLFDKDRAEEICDLLREQIFNQRRGRIHWKCQSRACFADRQLFRKMRMSGCELIFFGVESGNDEVLRQNKPNQDRNTVIQAVEDARAAGLRVRGSFMLGLPFDTRQSMKDTLQFAQDLQLDGYAFHVLDIYPGTKLWKTLQTNPHWGGLTVLREGEFSRGIPGISVNDASPQDIEAIRLNSIAQSYRKDGAIDRLRKNLTELRYYLDHDQEIFRKIANEKISEIKNLCQQEIKS